MNDHDIAREQSLAQTRLLTAKAGFLEARTRELHWRLDAERRGEFLALVRDRGRRPLSDEEMRRIWALADELPAERAAALVADWLRLRALVESGDFLRGLPDTASNDAPR